MPTPPHPIVNARRRSKARQNVVEREEANNVALKASGLYRTTTVEDRIRQWQANGAGSAPPAEPVSVHSPQSFEETDGSVSSCSEAAGKGDALPQTSNAKRQPTTIEVGHKLGSTRTQPSRAPGIRITGEEYLDKKKDSNQDQHPNGKARARQVSRVSALSTTEPGPTHTAKETRVDKEGHRKRRVEARSRRRQVSKEYIDKKKRSQAVSVSHQDLEDAHAPIGYNSDNVINKASSEISADRQPQSDTASSLVFVDDDDTPQEKSKYAQTLGRSPVHPKGTSKSKKESFLNKTKEALGIGDITPAISSRVPTIEAWLDEQDDHAAEQKIPKVRFKDEGPAPKRTQRANRKVSKKSPAPLDPNDIWDAIGSSTNFVPTTVNTYVLGEMENFKAKDEQLNSSTSSPALHKPGVKVSRQKPHRLPEIPHVAREPQRSDIKNATHTSVALPKQQKDLSDIKEKQSSPNTADAGIVSAMLEIGDAAPATESSDLRRKITTHEDMMTVLSRTSLRKNNKKIYNITNHEKTADQVKLVLKDLADEETKYCRELRTLVDGVIPVLLQCVLSKSNTAAATAFFSSSISPISDVAFSRPIVDMGVALERLKSLHTRMPIDNADALFSWCQTARKAYAEYVKAWRLGFQDVVINLAPLEDSEEENSEVMLRDANGDIVNSEGETVDIAYLMKRPLVNIRKLGRALSSLQEVMPDNPIAEKVAETYRELTSAAKTKHQQEKGRLEDESAANIDTSKCRDLQNITPLPAVTIDKTRRVRARDCFDATLFHSTGQRMDCKIELILRDNYECPDGGDLLICQIEEGGKWLLFAPADLSCVSARKGESSSDLVVMVRGRAGLGQEWRELLALKADVPEAVTEWLIMLGSNPLPPKLNRMPSFVNMSVGTSDSVELESSEVIKPVSQRIPSIKSVDVPIGEPSILSIRTPKDDGPKPEPEPEQQLKSKNTISVGAKHTSRLNMGGGLNKKDISHLWQSEVSSVSKKSGQTFTHLSDRSAISGYSTNSVSTYSPSSLAPMTPSAPRFRDVLRQEPSPGHQSQPQVPVQAYVPEQPQLRGEAQALPASRGTEQQRYGPQIMPVHGEKLGTPVEPLMSPTHAPMEQTVQPEPSFQEKRSSQTNERLESTTSPAMSNANRPVPARRPSYIPQEALPTVEKVRGPVATNTPLTETTRDTWSAISGFGRKVVSQPNVSATKDHHDIATPSVEITGPLEKEALRDGTFVHADEAFEHTLLLRSKNAKARHSMPLSSTKDRSTSDPPARKAAVLEHNKRAVDPESSGKMPGMLPQSKEESTIIPRVRSGPILGPSEAQKRMDKQNGRTSYSPLRKVHTPPSDSNTDYSDDELSASSDDDSRTSEDSEAEVANHGEALKNHWPHTYGPVPASVPTTGTRTLAPSDSASQGPYRRVPSSNTRPDTVKKRAIAMICSWNDNGSWEPLVEDYCAIVISGGLMEAFVMSEAYSKSDVEARQPLAAFELTPMVPLRRPTGLDISIRSPPTPDSQIQTSNNVMFRSQNAVACEALYQMINWARCNNPTYIELERSRPRPQAPVTFSHQESPRPRSWFSFGSGMRHRNSYRVGNLPPSSMGESYATANTTSSAMSALKRLTKSSSFNVNRSSVKRRSGRETENSLYSSSNGTGPDSSTNVPPSQAGFMPGKDGPNVPPTSAAALNGGGMVHNMKIRLQIRQSSGWVTMGISRLTILPAIRQGHESIDNSRPGSSHSSPGDGEISSRRASTNVGAAEPQQHQYRLSSSNYTPHRLHGGGREKRVVLTSDKDPSHVLLDATLGESCFEKISHLGIAVQVWKADDEVRSRGGVVLGQNTKYLFQFFHAKECAWVFELVGKYRYSTHLTN